MEGPISFWGYKEQESNLILPEHDDDDDDDDDDDEKPLIPNFVLTHFLYNLVATHISLYRAKPSVFFAKFQIHTNKYYNYIA